MKKPIYLDVIIILLACILLLPKFHHWGEKIAVMKLISEGVYYTVFAIVTGLLVTFILSKKQG